MQLENSGNIGIYWFHIMWAIPRHKPPSPIAMAITPSHGMMWSRWFQHGSSPWKKSNKIQSRGIIIQRKMENVFSNQKTPIMFIELFHTEWGYENLSESILMMGWNPYYQTYFDGMKHLLCMKTYGFLLWNLETLSKTPICCYVSYVNITGFVWPSFINSHPPSIFKIFKQPQTWFEICLGVETMVCEIFC